MVLVIHAAFVVFVVAGLVAILLGGALGWRWVRSPVFRLVHLAAIGVVMLQAWIGMLCPLTTLEMWLRERGGDAVYSGSFIVHWVERLLFHDAPEWVFTLSYTLFAMLVVLAYFAVRPRRRDGERR